MIVVVVYCVGWEVVVVVGCTLLTKLVVVVVG
jgi:hypothetical protein